MSRTDDHAPWWVQAQDQLWEPIHTCQRFHFPCDLPLDPPASWHDTMMASPTRCRWSPTEWHKIKWSRHSEWYMDKIMNRSRAKRQWRKEWDV